MAKEEEDDLANRTHSWLVRVAIYMDRVHREQIETQLKPSPRETCLQGLFLRAAMWLRTMAKLKETSDLQALAAGTRSLVEIAVDMLLIHRNKETAFPDRMVAWENSAKLKDAMQLVEHFRGREREVPSEYKAQVDFVNSEKVAIEKKRTEFWDGKHPRRWTGRNLPHDIKTVHEHHGDWLLKVFGLTLMEYYEADIRILNWYVHGSTLLGLRAGDEFLTRFRARCYEASAHLGMICAHVIQTDYRLFELFPEMRIEWEWLLNHRDLA